MKKITCTLLLLFSCAALFAQKSEKGVLILLTRGNAICDGTDWSEVEVKDKADMNTKMMAFKKEHPGWNNKAVFISESESMIVYEYRVKKAGFSCKPNAVNIQKGDTLEDCKKQMDNQYKKNPKGFDTAPSISASREAKK
jgi:hypothetical protein